MSVEFSVDKSRRVTTGAIQVVPSNNNNNNNRWHLLQNSS